MARHNIQKQCWYCWECDKEFDYEYQANECDCLVDNEWCEDNGSVGDPEDNND